MFGLYSVGQTIRSFLEGHTSDVTLKSVRPVPVGKESAQYRPAEILAAYSDLRSYRDLAQPSVKLRVIAVHLIKPTFDRQ